MGREPRSAAAASTAATQVLLVCWLFCGYCLGYPQPQSMALPVRYPGEVMIRRPVNTSTPKSLRGGHMIIFPDEERNSLSPPVDMTGNPICASSSKSTFCEQVDNYPTDEIRRLIQFDKSSFQELFGPEISVKARRPNNADDLSEEVLCKHQRHTFYPKLAKNDQNFWRYVINDVDYVQGVEAEVCVKEGKACSYVQNSLPGGHQAICRQRFSFKRLLSIDPDEKKTYMDSFRFASCCSCYVKVPALFERSNRGRATTSFPPNT